MSFMNDSIELKEEDLEKASGGVPDKYDNGISISFIAFSMKKECPSHHLEMKPFNVPLISQGNNYSQCFECYYCPEPHCARMYAYEKYEDRWYFLHNARGYIPK